MKTRKLGSIGIVLLVVVMAVVMYLTSRAWKNVAPVAIQTAGGKGAVVNDHGQSEAREELRAGKLPDLGATKSATNAHSAQVQEALTAAESSGPAD